MVEQCEQFIREKYNIFFREKLAADLSSELCSEMYLTEPYDERHSRLAFAEIFPHHVESIIGVEPPFILCNNRLAIDPQASQILYHIGLVHPTDEGKVHFIRRTCAEYFTSKLLTSWLRWMSKFTNNREVYKFLLTEILSTEKYNGIRSFFNQQLKSVSLRNDTLQQFGEVITELSIKTDLNIGPTVMRLAVAENCVKIAELLIKATKDCQMLLWHCLFCTHASRGTILRIAIRNSNSEMVKLILDAAEGISKDGPHELITNKDSHYIVRDTSIFLDVACSENLDILREVFRRSTNKLELVTESDGLHRFIFRGGQHEFLRAVFDELRDEKDFKRCLLACNSGGQTLLHYALIMPDPDDYNRCSGIVKLLLQEATNLNDTHVTREMIFATDAYGINALDQVTVAARDEFDTNFKILEQLCPEIWEEVNACYYNTSPFLFRMYRMRKELILYIKKNKLDKAKAILENAKTSHNPAERLKILLSNLCPPPPYKDDSKYSALHYACAFKRFDITNELLSYGLNINDDGETLRNLIRSPNPPYLYVYEKFIIGDIEQKNCSYLTPFELIHFKDHYPLTDYADRIKHITENLIENALENNNKHAVKVLREIPKKYAMGKIKISKFLKRIKDCSCSFGYNKKSSCSCKFHSEEYGDEYYFDAFPMNEMSDDDEATWI